MSPEPPSDDRPRRRIPRAALGALVVIALVGALVAAQRLGFIDTGSALSPEELEQLRADFDGEIPDGSEAQRLAAQDGTIDPAELFRLARNASNCSLMAGSHPVSVELGEWGLTRTVHFGNDPGDIDDLLAITDRCWDEHVGAAQMAYSNQVASR